MVKANALIELSIAERAVSLRLGDLAAIEITTNEGVSQD
jgi:hypothetical protein